MLYVFSNDSIGFGVCQALEVVPTQLRIQVAIRRNSNLTSTSP